MDHPFARGEKVYDVTFENVQAGLRTDYLFRLANQRGGIVLGTGDLSELALGWSTYGVGDQMSHYNVNGGVPKTLIQHLIRWVISSRPVRRRRSTRCCRRCSTPRSPPNWCRPARTRRSRAARPRSDPYVLQDFSLFQVLRYGFRPSKVAFLAWHAWSDADRGDWPAGFPDERAPGVLAEGDSALAAGVRAAVLLVQPVQALGTAERAEGVARRRAVAARGLAGAVGHVGADLARRDRARGPPGLRGPQPPVGASSRRYQRS